MEKIFESGDTVGTIFANVDQNIIELANVTFRLAYPSYTLRDFATPASEPVSPAAGDCYLVSAPGTVWGLTVVKDNIINYTGAAWEVLPEKITQLEEKISENILIENQFMGLSVPINGSTAMTRTGYAVWNATPFFLNDIALVLLADDGTENEVLANWGQPKIPTGADLTGASGQVMVRFPKIYYREIFDNAGVNTGLSISPNSLPGHTLHPCFSHGVGRNYIYISAYEPSADGSTKLKSASGVEPLTAIALSVYRSRALARGAKWYDYDYWTNHYLQLLFYFMYANLNSQEALPGYTDASAYLESYKRLTGRTNNLESMSGSVDVDLAVTDVDLTGILASGKKIANRFLFVENFFGHIWKMLDGVSFDGRIGQPNTAYITNNPALFSSDPATILANYTDLNISMPANPIVDYIEQFQQAFLPKKYGGSSTTHTCDYFYSYLDDETRDYLRLVRAGGGLISGGIAGVAARDSFFDLGAALSTVGSRLCFAP